MKIVKREAYKTEEETKEKVNENPEEVSTEPTFSPTEALKRLKKKGFKNVEMKDGDIVFRIPLSEYKTRETNDKCREILNAVGYDSAYGIDTYKNE